MKIVTIIDKAIMNNTYLLYNDGSNEGVIIDPSANYEGIKEAMQSANIVKVTVLLTHGHFDHCSSAYRLQRDYNAKVYVHKDDGEKTQSKIKSYSAFIDRSFETFLADEFLSGGEELDIADIKIKVLHLRGHSCGGLGFIIDNNLFAGDTLFRDSYGRYDFFDGDFNELYNSIVNILFALEGDYTVYCGHDKITTLAYERENNPIFKDYEEYKKHPHNKRKRS